MREAPLRKYRIRKARPREAAEGRLALADPAVHLVTDFVWEQPVMVPEELSIDDALREMILAGVCALLVVRESGYRRHDEIEVGHIMTPWERVPTLDWQALGQAHPGRCRDG